MIYNDKIIYAGYSTLPDGSIKFRTARTQARVHQLAAQGEAVTMTLLPDPVDTKQQAARALIAMDYCGDDAAVVDLFVQRARDENPFKRGARVVKVKVPTRFRQELTGAGVEAVETPADTVKLTPRQRAQLRAEFNARVKAAYEAN